MPSFDVIVIGGGVNGLACAARLAGKGRKVLLLEAGAVPGGGAGERDFAPCDRAPDFGSSSFSHLQRRLLAVPGRVRGAD